MASAKAASDTLRAEDGLRLAAYQDDGVIARVRQTGSTPWAPRCWSMNVIIAVSGGRAPPQETGGGLQDLVRPPELADLQLELIHHGPLPGREAGSREP